MALLSNIYKISSSCDGTGEIDSTIGVPEDDQIEPHIVKITCLACEGTGELLWGRIIKE